MNHRIAAAYRRMQSLPPVRRDFIEPPAARLVKAIIIMIICMLIVFNIMGCSPIRHHRSDGCTGQYRNIGYGRDTKSVLKHYQ